MMEWSNFARYAKEMLTYLRNESMDAHDGRIPLTVIRAREAYNADDRPLKEDEIKIIVMGWLMKIGWRSVHGTDPPDLFATNGKRMIGIEVVSYRLARHTFDVSEESLSFDEGEIYFVIVVEVEKGHFEPLILSRNEMKARCKGKHMRGNRSYSSASRSLEGWIECHNNWDRLEN